MVESEQMYIVSQPCCKKMLPQVGAKKKKKKREREKAGGLGWV